MREWLRNMLDGDDVRQARADWERIDAECAEIESRLGA